MSSKGNSMVSSLSQLAIAVNYCARQGEGGRGGREGREGRGGGRGLGLCDECYAHRKQYRYSLAETPYSTLNSRSARLQGVQYI